MGDVNITLKVLKELLEKKQAALEGILGISQNQETILRSAASQERAESFKGTQTEKQRLIADVKKYDEMFQSFFDSARGSLSDDALSVGQKGVIVELKALINTVLELDILIRAQEKKNTEASSVGFAPFSAAPTPIRRNRALDELNKHGKL